MEGRIADSRARDNQGDPKENNELESGLRGEEHKDQNSIHSTHTVAHNSSSAVGGKGAVTLFWPS